MTADIDQSQPPTMPWAGRAACAEAGRDPEIWFPKSGVSEYMPGRPQTRGIAEAKAICAGCEVRRECLDHAFGDRRLVGIWGGLTEQERWAAGKGPCGRQAGVNRHKFFGEQLCQRCQAFLARERAARNRRRAERRAVGTGS